VLFLLSLSKFGVFVNTRRNQFDSCCLYHFVRHSSSFADRGVIVVSIVFGGGRSFYCLHFDISQLMGPQACFEIFARVLLGWLRNPSLCQMFPVYFYQAVGTQANVAKIHFKLKGRIEKIFCRLLVSPRLGTIGTNLLKISGTSFGCPVNPAILVQMSQNMLRIQ